MPSKEPLQVPISIELRRTRVRSRGAWKQMTLCQLLIMSQMTSGVHSTLGTYDWPWRQPPERHIASYYLDYLVLFLSKPADRLSTQPGVASSSPLVAEAPTAEPWLPVITCHPCPNSFQGEQTTGCSVWLRVQRHFIVSDGSSISYGLPGWLP